MADEREIFTSEMTSQSNMADAQGHSEGNNNTSIQNNPDFATVTEPIRISEQAPSLALGHVGLGDVNENLMCALCDGYLIGATTLTSCLHSFCRSCIVRHLRTTPVCPRCANRINIKSTKELRQDHVLQELVYTLVPGLFEDEMKRRRSFYMAQTQQETPPDSSRDKICVCLRLFDRYPPFDEKSDIKCLDTRFLLCPGEFPVRLLERFIRLKFNVNFTHKVTLYLNNERLYGEYSLYDVTRINELPKGKPLSVEYVIEDTIPRLAHRIQRYSRSQVSTSGQLTSSRDQCRHGNQSEATSCERYTSTENALETSRISLHSDKTCGTNEGCKSNHFAGNTTSLHNTFVPNRFVRSVTPKLKRKRGRPAKAKHRAAGIIAIQAKRQALKQARMRMTPTPTTLMTSSDVTSSDMALSDMTSYGGMTSSSSHMKPPHGIAATNVMLSSSDSHPISDNNNSFATVKNEHIMDNSRSIDVFQQISSNDNVLDLSNIKNRNENRLNVGSQISQVENTHSNYTTPLHASQAMTNIPNVTMDNSQFMKQVNVQSDKSFLDSSHTTNQPGQLLNNNQIQTISNVSKPASIIYTFNNQTQTQTNHQSLHPSPLQQHSQPTSHPRFQPNTQPYDEEPITIPGLLPPKPRRRGRPPKRQTNSPRLFGANHYSPFSHSFSAVIKRKRGRPPKRKVGLPPVLIVPQPQQYHVINSVQNNVLFKSQGNEIAGTNSVLQGHQANMENASTPVQNSNVTQSHVAQASAVPQGNESQGTPVAYTDMSQVPSGMSTASLSHYNNGHQNAQSNISLISHDSTHKGNHTNLTENSASFSQGDVKSSGVTMQLNHYHQHNLNFQTVLARSQNNLHTNNLQQNNGNSAEISQSLPMYVTSQPANFMTSSQISTTPQQHNGNIYITSPSKSSNFGGKMLVMSPYEQQFQKFIQSSSSRPLTDSPLSVDGAQSSSPHLPPEGVSAAAPHMRAVYIERITELPSVDNTTVNNTSHHSVTDNTSHNSVTDNTIHHSVTDNTSHRNVTDNNSSHHNVTDYTPHRSVTDNTSRHNVTDNMSHLNATDNALKSSTVDHPLYKTFLETNGLQKGSPIIYVRNTPELQQKMQEQLKMRQQNVQEQHIQQEQQSQHQQQMHQQQLIQQYQKLQQQQQIQQQMQQQHLLQQKQLQQKQNEQPQIQQQNLENQQRDVKTVSNIPLSHCETGSQSCNLNQNETDLQQTNPDALNQSSVLDSSTHPDSPSSGYLSGNQSSPAGNGMKRRSTSGTESKEVKRYKLHNITEKLLGERKPSVNDSFTDENQDQNEVISGSNSISADNVNDGKLMTQSVGVTQVETLDINAGVSNRGGPMNNNNPNVVLFEQGTTKNQIISSSANIVFSSQAAKRVSNGNPKVISAVSKPVLTHQSLYNGLPVTSQCFSSTADKRSIETRPSSPGNALASIASIQQLVNNSPSLQGNPLLALNGTTVTKHQINKTLGEGGRFVRACAPQSIRPPQRIPQSVLDRHQNAAALIARQKQAWLAKQKRQQKIKTNKLPRSNLPQQQQFNNGKVEGSSFTGPQQGLGNIAGNIGPGKTSIVRINGGYVPQNQGQVFNFPKFSNAIVNTQNTQSCLNTQSVADTPTNVTPTQSVVANIQAVQSASPNLINPSVPFQSTQVHTTLGNNSRYERKINDSVSTNTHGGNNTQLGTVTSLASTNTHPNTQAVPNTQVIQVQDSSTNNIQHIFVSSSNMHNNTINNKEQFEGVRQISAVRPCYVQPMPTHVTKTHTEAVGDFSDKPLDFSMKKSR